MAPTVLGVSPVTTAAPGAGLASIKAAAPLSAAMLAVLAFLTFLIVGRRRG
jgi:hypothetical protein